MHEFEALLVLVATGLMFVCFLFIALVEWGAHVTWNYYERKHSQFANQESKIKNP